MTLALFDMEPLTPVQVIRRRGVHPVTLLALDPDENRTCGNCATRRWVFDDMTCKWHDTVCAAVSRCRWDGARSMAAGGPDPDDFCEDECCTASGGCGWGRAWPWEEAVDETYPACVRWSDLEAERALVALGGSPQEPSPNAARPGASGPEGDGS